MGSGVKAMLGALVVTCVLPSLLKAQRRGPDAQAVEGYYRTVGAAFSVSLEEVRILGEWQLPPEEIAVVLFLARRAGVSPDVIATQRGAGAPWASIVQRYGVSAGVFHISFPPGTSLGPLADTYQSFAATPRASWATLPLEDGALVTLVNIRILSNQLGVPVARVLAAWERIGDLVLVHEQLTSS